MLYTAAYFDSTYSSETIPFFCYAVKQVLGIWPLSPLTVGVVLGGAGTRTEKEGGSAKPLHTITPSDSPIAFSLSVYSFHRRLWVFVFGVLYNTTA